MWRRMDSGEEGQREMQTSVGSVVGGLTAQTGVTGWGDWVEGKGEGESQSEMKMWREGEREREREREGERLQGAKHRGFLDEWTPRPRLRQSVGQSVAPPPPSRYLGLFVARKLSSTSSSSLYTSVYMLVRQLLCHLRVRGVGGGWWWQRRRRVGCVRRQGRWSQRDAARR